MSVRSDILTRLGDLPQPLHQHHRLDQLDVAELGVPVDVGGADQDVLPHLFYYYIYLYIYIMCCPPPSHWGAARSPNRPPWSGARPPGRCCPWSSPCSTCPRDHWRARLPTG